MVGLKFLLLIGRFFGFLNYGSHVDSLFKNVLSWSFYKIRPVVKVSCRPLDCILSSLLRLNLLLNISSMYYCLVAWINPYMSKIPSILLFIRKFIHFFNPSILLELVWQHKVQVARESIRLVQSVFYWTDSNDLTCAKPIRPKFIEITDLTKPNLGQCSNFFAPWFFFLSTIFK